MAQLLGSSWKSRSCARRGPAAARPTAPTTRGGRPMQLHRPLRRWQRTGNRARTATSSGRAPVAVATAQ
eukprot:1900341-Lingulodinium_polyedra.AAC.1